MPDPAKAAATQLANIQTRLGKTLPQLEALIRTTGLVKHGEIRDMLKRELGLGHGDANALAHHALKAEATPSPSGEGFNEILDGIYKGPKAALRPIHDALMAHIRTFGPFAEAPKKDYISLRRKKQFAMIGPATNSRVEVGLNLKGFEGTQRLLALPPGRMCPFKVKLSTLADVDAELFGWLQEAFTQSG